MRYRRFEPLGLDLSVLVLGTADFGAENEEESRVLLDEWIALGGNALDTARQYGATRWGAAEEVIARWLADRGVRDRVVVGTKGGHHKVVGERRVNPADLREDIEGSLDALGTHIDTYLLHRDDPSHPVGPVVELLDEYRRGGAIRAYGASNWTTARIEEANAYAEEHGLAGFSFSSPNLSLAVQNEPPWEEALSASDSESRAWYARTQMPLFAWSSQAGGWFTGHYSPHADVPRVYDNPGNRERLRRAQELGVRKSADANAVALAWVLHQPFPTWALIGPRTVEELRTSVAALVVTITDDEARWLNLED